jgi:hypothetical protein
LGHIGIEVEIHVEVLKLQYSQVLGFSTVPLQFMSPM